MEQKKPIRKFLTPANIWRGFCLAATIAGMCVLASGKFQSTNQPKAPFPPQAPQTVHQRVLVPREPKDNGKSRIMKMSRHKPSPDTLKEFSGGGSGDSFTF